jgi:hypothetical protein
MHPSSSTEPMIPFSTAASKLTAQRAHRASMAAYASRAKGKRIYVDPATCDRYYSDSETEFLTAIQAYKQRSGRSFPTWSEVLEVFLSLGYEKAGNPTAPVVSCAS